MRQNSVYSFSVSLVLSNLIIVSAYSFADDQYDFRADKSRLDKVEVIDTIEVVAESEGGLILNTRTRVNRNELNAIEASTLGETLNKISGVQGSSFGPGSNMPMIRSLSGTRVSIVNNHLDVNDVAAISGNLPIAVEPMMAESITVEKTGANVLYGGKAIGGAIYIEDSRIPKKLLENSKKFSGSIDVSTGYNTERKQAFRLDGNNGKNWAWHVDASQRKVSAVRIPSSAKASMCYDENVIYTSGQYAGVDSRLAALCQVNAKSNTIINPAYFPYLNARYDSSNSEDNPYASQKDYFDWSTFTAGTNPDNPQYQPNAPYYVSVPSPITDISPIEYGKIPNSHLHQKQFTLGTSYIGSQGYVGISFNRYLNHYGVPGFSSVATRTGVNGRYVLVDIHSQQTRWTLEGKWEPDNRWLKSIQLSSALTYSKNGEYLGGTVSSLLDSKLQQIRFEVQRQNIGISSATYGFDWKKRTIMASGADAYLPNNETYEQGVFALEQLNFERVQLEAGWRTGWVKHYRDASFKSYYGSLNSEDRRFNLNQKHLAVKWKIYDNLSIHLQRTLAQRAPEVHELYAGNKHLAILAQETGQGKLQKEKSYSTNLSLNWQHNGFQVALSYYDSRFKNYAYLASTGGVRDNLVVKQWRQADQRVQGYEIDLSYRWYTQNNHDWKVGIFVDQVKNFMSDKSESNQQNIRLNGIYIPGLPASRYGVTLDWQNANWRMYTAIVRYQKQKNGANYTVNTQEPVMPAYTLWDINISYRHSWLGNQLTWYVEGKNLTNKEARPFNSPLKYLTPLAGRSVSFGVKMDF